MKTKNTIWIVSVTIGLHLLCINGCKKEQVSIPPTIPEVNTSPFTEITQTTTKGGGDVVADGGSNVTARGVCWSTNAAPTIADSKTTDGAGTGSFVSDITGLSYNTTYAVRAYATNSIGTAYGNEINFKTLPVTDIDDNEYNTASIGTQIWLVENLKATKYNDGTAIPLVTDNSTWSYLTTGGYCWHNNDATNKEPYGAIYNWFAVNSGKLCPTGWHVPSDAEWTTLTTFLGGESVAGGKLKEMGTTHWLSPNTGATNEGGFTALPGSDRSVDGTFNDFGNAGIWWSATESAPTLAAARLLSNDSGGVLKTNFYEEVGLSVRCVKN